ncbi:Hypothetical predicted protein [Mytilus galloprovincialis]|uniref:Uncharacterized protein n=1 Tax=Mytilus galloprovincialis TaxID=29158 RepID=A0A8B6CEI1_MYTGA|nr:Hypothetical predicted protein [Mytilus galloprovincialis]
MQAAGRGMHMDAFVVGPVELKIVVQLESDLSAELTDFIIEPNKEIDLLIPRGYYNASVLPCVSLLNVTNNKIVLQKGTLLGEAIEADVVETGPAPSVATTGIARDNNPLPEQLQNILDKSSTLTKDQQSKVANLLHEFVDVFALDDFDLGTFSHIEHEIDTGDARPIKQRIRRTPMCFCTRRRKPFKENVRCRTINRDGMAIGSEYVEVVKKWKVPTTTRESWLGFQEDVDNVIPLASNQDCKSFEPIGPHTVLPSSLISDDNLLKQDNTQHIHVITEDNTSPDSSIPQDEDQNVTSHVKENSSTFQVQQQVFESTNQDIVNQNQNVCHSSVEIVTTPLGMSVYATYLDFPNVNAITETGIEASTYSPEQLRDYQSKDPDLELILVWFRDKTEPSEATIFQMQSNS